MNWRRTRPAGDEPARDTSVVQVSGAARRSGPAPDNAGWTIFSYLLSGMLVYGLLGWLLATLTHIGLLIPLGALAGLVVAIFGIIYKYGRS